MQQWPTFEHFMHAILNDECVFHANRKNSTPAGCIYQAVALSPPFMVVVDIKSLSKHIFIA